MYLLKDLYPESKKISKLNTKKPNNPTVKQANNWKRHCMKSDPEMASITGN